MDIIKSTVYRPYYTHLKVSYQPLKPEEIVEAEVEIWPTTALIRQGFLIRLDAQAIYGDHMPVRNYDIIDRTYQKKSINTINTGPNHRPYLQLPIVPPKQQLFIFTKKVKYSGYS